MSAEEIQINDSVYWNNRFEGDWEEKGGRAQSVFFSVVAFEHMPDWMKRFMIHEQPSVCDWGCALGDGTDYLRRALGLKNTWGIDFSATSIEKAKSTYPGVQFVQADLTTDNFEQEFDIIFSSNTLEHFYDPWATLTTVSKYARQHLILLIPYQEYELCSKEHFYTFNNYNIPFCINQTFFLTHSSVIDTANRPATQWFGKQILLIYSQQQQARKLFLSDLAIADEETDNKKLNLPFDKAHKAKELPTALPEVLTQAVNSEPEHYTTMLAEKELLIQNLNQTINEVTAANETAIRNAAAIQTEHRSQLDTQQKAYEDALRNLQQLADANAAQYTQLKSQKDEAQVQIRALTESIAQLQQQNETLYQNSDDHDKTCNQLTELNEVLRSDVDLLAREKDAALQSTQQLEAEIIALASEKNSYYQALVAAKEEARLLETKLTSVNLEISKISMQEGQLQDRIQQIEQSQSWQLTKPLRTTIDLFKKNLGKKPQ